MAVLPGSGGLRSAGRKPGGNGRNGDRGYSERGRKGRGALHPPGQPGRHRGSCYRGGDPLRRLRCKPAGGNGDSGQHRSCDRLALPGSGRTDGPAGAKLRRSRGGGGAADCPGGGGCR